MEAEAEAWEYPADQKVIHSVGIGSDTPANRDINQGWEGHSFSGSPALCAPGTSLTLGLALHENKKGREVKSEQG